jgi:hypothetical protein
MKKPAIAALSLLVALSFGCSPTEKGGKSAERGASRAVPSKEIPEKSAELPADFPRDVPVLKGATVKLAMSQGKRSLLHLYTSSTVADAAKYYDDALKREGWKIESSTRSSDMATIAATKGSEVFGVTIAKEGRGTLIRLAVSEGRS